MHYRPPKHFARLPYVLRTACIALGPALVLTAWSLMFTADQVYAVSIPPAVTYSIAAVVLLIVPAVFARLLLGMSAGAEQWLHRQADAAGKRTLFQNEALLQQQPFI